MSQKYKFIKPFIKFEKKQYRIPITSLYCEMAPFTTQSMQLHKGDIIYMTSDGYADQFGGPKNKKIKMAHLKELLLQNCKKPMNKQKEILVSTFEKWKGNLEQIDDVFVLGIKI